MTSLDLPYRCPRCGDHKRFRSLSSLRAHLEYCHTYETLYVLSKSSSVCDGALVPLVSPVGGLQDVLERTAFSVKEHHFPYELPCAEELGLAAARYIPNMEIPLSEIFIKKDMAMPSNPGTAIVVATGTAASAVEAAYEEGLARLKVRAFEKLELDERLEKLSEEVEQKIAARVGRLQVELEKKSSELEKARQESIRLSQEKQDLEDKASELSRQVNVSVEMLATLKQDLVNKEQELTSKQQEVSQIDQFLQETAAREANAKVRLQQFIEELLDRADRAEKQLQIISSCGTTPNGSLGQCSMAGSKGTSCQRNSCAPGGSRGVYHVSDRQPSANTRVCGRMKSASQGSGGYDSDGVDMNPLEECAEAQYYHVQCRLGDGGYERAAITRSWGLRKQALQNWQRHPYHNSTEGEEGDVSDVGSRATESEGEAWEQERRASSDTQHSSSSRGYWQGSGRSVGAYKPSRQEKGSPSKSNEVISPEVLKMRAALFCIFTYLDTKTLLQAAEVCRDWKFVARHPAVWTGVMLENARVSSKFLITLSQWCTQTHSLILQNLKPRQRGKKESKDEYLKSTRGCLEEGLEAILKATEGNLLILKVSHCANILTDRSLWLASCYCRALQAVTYRSSTDPIGQEVELKVQWQAFSNEAEKLLAANSNYEEGLLAEAEEDSTKLSEQQTGDIEKESVIRDREAERAKEETEGVPLGQLDHDCHERQLHHLEELATGAEKELSAWRDWAPVAAIEDMERRLHRLMSSKNKLRRDRDAEIGKARKATEEEDRARRTTAERERQRAEEEERARRAQLILAQQAEIEARAELVKAQRKALEKTQTTERAGAQGGDAATRAIPKVRLKPTSLPTFSGSMREYYRWRKDWESLQQQGDPSGSPEVKKFQLLESVEETIVKDLRLASHNTAKDVFRVLENRFGNKNAITILIVAELQKISPVKEHQFRKVIDLIRITEKALADLKDLDNEAAIKNPLVTGAIENKLPLTLKKEWLTFKEDPKNSVQPESYFDALLDFLQKQERILEQLEQMEITEFPEKKTEKKFASTRATERGSTEDNCVLCENKHRSRLFTCKKFRGLDLAARKAAVKKSRACRLCLSSHGADGECNLKFLCTKKGCKKESQTTITFSAPVETVRRMVGRREKLRVAAVNV
ncbi:hypothetical protein AAFF_G00348680 [Aldrovandia affinis]|uniref:F-box domain-containing protein n=1 Tax=Aldrovandia affinis TaxID=143900 RepID=A0AAD7WNL0_9TELE|nr:hypothetical protein AAFF_G00348680 [Aldrovandia affinis]